MADDERIHTGGPEAPPAGEAIHLPGPSYLPIVTAVGLTIVVVGVVQSWIIVAIGLLITLVRCRAGSARRARTSASSR